MAILKIPILVGLFLILWSVLAKGEMSIVDALAASIDESYTVKTEDKEYDNMNYTVHSYQFHDRDKRSIGAIVQRLCVMSFNIQNFHSKKASKQNKAKAIANVIYRSGADLIALQESRNQESAKDLTNILNGMIGHTEFHCVTYASGVSNRREWYTFIYRSKLMTYIRDETAPSVTLPKATKSGKKQTRPPVAVEFLYHAKDWKGAIITSFKFTVMTIHTSPTPRANVKTEINELRDFFIEIASRFTCFSANLIIMGDFNQGFNYVGKTWKSDLDNDSEFKEVVYTGGSTMSKKNAYKQDRIYTYGSFFNNNINPYSPTSTDRALVWTAFPHNPTSAQNRVSDHYPVLFQIDTASITHSVYRGLACQSENLKGRLPTPPPTPPPCKKKRNTELDPCTTCFNNSSQLINGVYPAGSTSSSQALNVNSTPIHRTDVEFLNFLYLTGDLFIFIDEESNSQWCGTEDSPCIDCKESYTASITSYCSDRIMCPFLSEKLIELYQKQMDCLNENRTLIIHETWDEPDSIHPDGVSSVDSLHRSGQEAVISISTPLEDIALNERNYSSDNSLLETLATMAVCVGFDYVRINTANNTVSVAVRECVTNDTRVPLCQEPQLFHGKYFGNHNGPLFQLGEYIYALCQPGYLLEGQITRQCIDEQSWSGEAPRCTEACSNQNITSCAQPIFDYIKRTIDYVCQNDCSPCPENATICNTISGIFEPANVTECIDDLNSTCDTPVAPNNGYVYTVHGIRGETCSVVQYTCAIGSELIGEPFAMCMPDGQWNFPPPICKYNLSITEFSVIGFQYIRSSKPIDPREPTSLASATYIGRLISRYPPFELNGIYNITTDRITFIEELSPLSLDIVFKVDVDISLWQIVEYLFHVHLDEPYPVDLTGFADLYDCFVTFSSDIQIPEKELTIQTAFNFVLCENCSRICSAQAVQVAVYLHQPWNISLVGNYSLDDNITSVSASGVIDINGFNIRVSTAIGKSNDEIFVEELSVFLHFDFPFEVDLYGSYSRITQTASLSGSLALSSIQFMISLVLNIETDELSDLSLSGSLSSPFILVLAGSYSLNSNSSSLNVSGTISIDNFINITLAAEIDFTQRQVLSYDLYGAIADPLSIIITAHYSSLNTSTLDLMGNLQLQGGHEIKVNTSIYTTDPPTLKSIQLNGVLPPPLDFISFNGYYNRECSCANIRGIFSQDSFTITASTTLVFLEDTLPTITSLNIQIDFNSPLDIILEGLYIYSNDSNASFISAFGQLNTSEVVFATEVELIISKMRSVRLQYLRFVGTFGHPLGLTVMGDYNSTSHNVALHGSLSLDFAQLNASTLYTLQNSVHNTSSMIGDVIFMGRLIKPFHLEVEGYYMFSTATFKLDGSVQVNQYLILAVNVIMNTSSNPVSIDRIKFAGELTTPIAFRSKFEGEYNGRDRTAVLSSRLDIGSVTLDAKGSLSIGNNTSFYFQSINITGMLAPPLSIHVSAVYLPSDSSVLDLTGYMEIGSISLVANAHAEKSNVSNGLTLQYVEFSGSISTPIMLSINGTYRMGFALMLSGVLDLPELILMASTSVNLSIVPREIDSWMFTGYLKSPFDGTSVSAEYNSGELILSGMIDLANLDMSIKVYLNNLNSTDGVTVSKMEFFTSLSTPFSLMLSGAYKLGTNSSSLNVSGTIIIDNFINLTLTAEIDFTQRQVLSYGLYGAIADPLSIIITAHYSSLNTSTLDLMGNLQLQGGHEIEVNTSIYTTDPPTLKSIQLNGVLPPPLDFISFNGYYNRECSCANIRGIFSQDSFTITASTTLAFLEDTLPTITSLNIQIDFNSPLDIILEGLYVYSNDSNASFISAFGQLNTSEVVFATEVELIISKMRSVRLQYLRFVGTFRHPLSLTVMGDYNSTSHNVALHGSLSLDFAQLNASTLYTLQNSVHNTSSMIGDVIFMGRLIKPFHLEVEGYYMFSTATFKLDGSIQVNQYLILAVNVIMNTSSNPVSIDRIKFAGELTTPIAFRSKFEGEYNGRDRTAVLSSRLDIGSVTLDAKGSLSIGNNTSFYFQSINITGMLAPPLSIRVSAVYLPSDSSVLDLTGYMEIGSISLVANAHAEKSNVSNGLTLQYVEFSGSISTPIMLSINGTYRMGFALMLSGVLDLPELILMASTSVNLSIVPREIDSWMFTGYLKSPFDGTSVSAEYNSGELILSGMIDLANLDMSIKVYFNTTNEARVNKIQFFTAYHPLSLSLYGTYDRFNQQLELVGTISISSLDNNITAKAYIDMSKSNPTLSKFSMSVTFNEPSIALEGLYDNNTQNALLKGTLKLQALTLSGSALLHLGNPKRLNEIRFNINYTIPFGDMLSFLLQGTYISSTHQIVLEGSLQQNSNDIINGLLILNTTGSPTIQVIALSIHEINIASLVQKYIGISWPAENFPLVIKDIAIYKANIALTHGNIPYKQGSLHARGEVTIFVIPTFILEASLIKQPTRLFSVSLQLKNAINWGLFVLCGTTDLHCNTTGPSLSVQVGSNENRFVFEGGFKLFEINIGSVELAVSKKYISASVTLSQQIADNFLGIVPKTIEMFWNDEGFHTNLNLQNLIITNFKFQNIKSRDICRRFSRYISEFAINTPFHLDTNFIVSKTNGTLWFGVIINGSVDLNIANEHALTVIISPISFGARLPKGQQISWPLFLKMIEQGIKSAGQQIMDNLIKDSEAARLIALGQLGKLAVGEAAATICKNLLNMPPPPPPDPIEPINPQEYPEVPKNPSDLSSLIQGGELVGGIGVNVVGQAIGGFLTFVSSGSIRKVGCSIMKIFGGCGGDSNNRDDENLNKIKQQLQQMSCDDGYCAQQCQQILDILHCSCNDGYYLDSDGHSCIRFNRCSSSNHNPCNVNANCTDNLNGTDISCTCRTGFTGNGITCTDINECDNPDVCPEHSSCVNTVGSFLCNCHVGYYKDGDQCKDINECLNTTICPAHSVCVNTDGSYLCNCEVGYIKNDSLCIDVNECLLDNVCTEHGICNNTEGSFICVCDNGYRFNGTTCIDINECNEGTPCDQHAVCVNTDGSYICTCISGFTGNGTRCSDIDECAGNSTVCDPNAECSNTIGSYQCHCLPGFTGNGSLCQDIDECAGNSTVCDPNAECSNTIGSYQCQCLLGFTGNGSFCYDIDECAGNSTVCDPNAECSNTIGSYQCHCLPGFTGNGSLCQDIDECAGNSTVCDPNAECSNTIGSYQCHCLPGFTGNGSLCQDIDECAGNSTVCDPNAECNNTIGSYKCYCYPGYERNNTTNCTDVDECLQPNTCDQFAICNNTEGSFECMCIEGYTGNGLNCSLVSCGILSLPPNSHYIHNEGNLFNQSVIIQCNQSFIPQDLFILTCQANGMWSGILPQCGQECPIPQRPMNGHFTYIPTGQIAQPGTRVIFTCDFGYTIEGNSIATCLSTGNWSSDETPICLPGLDIKDMYPFGPSQGDIDAPKNDDDSVEVDLTFSFPYFDTAETTLYVATNGIIVFRNPITHYTPQPFPNGVIMMAPYWADVDTRLPAETPPGSLTLDEINHIWYREDFNTSLLQLAASQIHDAFPEHFSFIPRSLFIVTWDKVGYYNRHIDKLNTFQCVLATDGLFSFALYLYPREGIQWTTGDASDGSNGLGGTPAQVGFNAGDNTRYNVINSSRTPAIIRVDEGSNVGKIGLYMFQVDGSSVSAGGCTHDTIKFKFLPLTVSANGGAVLTLYGPCFDNMERIICQFNGVFETTGVIKNSRHAYCPVPLFKIFGQIYVQLQLHNSSTVKYYYSSQHLTIVSLDYLHYVTFDMPGILLYSDGDPVKITWNPSNVLPTSITSPTNYDVRIELYYYYTNISEWQKAAVLVSRQSNNGSAQLSSLPTAPNTTNGIVPMSFKIVALNSSSVPDYINPLLQSGEVSIWSPLSYKITNKDYTLKSRELCLNWYNRTIQNEEELITVTLPACPCTVTQARIGNSGFMEQRSPYAIKMRQFFYSQASTCFLSVNIDVNREGQECCYDRNGLLFTGPRNGGTADRYVSRIDTSPWDHYISDILPQIHCCKAPGSSSGDCNRYYELRFSDGCLRFNPEPPAFLFGDPHMITLDGLRYTYNGAGEYIVLNALNGTFILQARTEPAERIDGGTPVGTAFTAIAVKKSVSVTIEVQRSTVRGLNILVNGERLSYTEPTVWMYNNVTVTYEGNSTASIQFASGEFIRVRNTLNFLFLEIASLPEIYQNNTKGLLGVWNGNPDDDLTNSDGVILDSNSTLREIHVQFGETWRIMPNDSLFTYIFGQSPSTFDNRTFIPVFDISDLPFNVTDVVQQTCGDNLECLFDVGATGRIEVGQATRNTQRIYNETIMLSQPVICDPPCKNNAPCVDTNVCNCPPAFIGDICDSDLDECLNGTHDCEHQCNNTYGGYECSCNEGYVLHPNQASCIDIDECLINNGGCICHSLFVNCVPYCNNFDGSYNCSCNDGYKLAKDNKTCIDINECADGLHNCEHICMNFHGQFECLCFEGYILDTDNTSCIDINECLTGNGGCMCDPNTSNCISYCHNYPGSHNCSCKNGYKLDSHDGRKCIDINECTETTHTCQQKCTNIDGTFECLCIKGYILDTHDNATCYDINECLEENGGCSCEYDSEDCVSTCINNPGHYNCSCSQGYELGSDKMTCIDIDECLKGIDNCSCGVLSEHECDVDCLNTNGSFYCECISGFEISTNNTCLDINECLIDNGGCICDESLSEESTCSVKCNNMNGSHSCHCSQGYILNSDNTTCIDIDECSINNGGCLCDSQDNNCIVYCNNTEGFFQCVCNTGYTLLADNKTCQEIIFHDDEGLSASFIGLIVGGVFIFVFMILTVLMIIVCAGFHWSRRQHTVAESSVKADSNIYAVTEKP